MSPDSRLIELLKQPGGPLLELPIGPEGVGPTGLPVNHARAMYRAIYHGRPVLNGYSSYYPAAFPARMELARRLPDPAALEELHRNTGLEMILVHGGQLASAEGLRRLPAPRPVRYSGAITSESTLGEWRTALKMHCTSDSASAEYSVRYPTTSSS